MLACSAFICAYTRLRYQVSVYRTIGPLLFFCFLFNVPVNNFYAPNFEEVWEAYWFGPVRPSICVLHLHSVKNR